MVVDDVEEIKKLKARYFRLMDAKDWAAMRELFTSDMRLDATGTGGGVVVGVDDFVAMLAETLAGTTTAHHGHMPEIELTSATSATGVWALADLIVFPDKTRLTGSGHYHDTYVKVDGAWRISSSTVTRLLMEVIPPPAQ